ncbi:mid region of cactin-domain-containing protein [Radiomyces spectabilis]|uniref:mid region of cactin-domain-containing protein n=1 Tax=Radiomyces spectabilis TaxID=64574 RepID=UPI00221F8419|nr:mid region of cactin-domain-containing protein [Radiomyces spectabilis]KAI8374525.1 mid region of cactin-domain-containing protein [Radiomyces spectabilis]
MARSPDRHRHRSRSRSEEYRSKKKSHHKRSRSPSEDTHRSRKKEKKSKKHKKHRHYSDEEDDAEKSSLRPSLETLGYSNVNNPFNDVNLESKFVWTKKKQNDRKKGLDPDEIRRRERERQREADEELAKLNKRRAEREEEMRLREEEMARLQRDAELAQMGDWQAKEEEFHLEQAKKRAEIRIKSGRAKPIDILAMNLRLANEPDKVEEDVELEIDLEEPYTIFDNLTLEETKELHEDIQLHISLEKNEKTLEFWRAMIVVADDRLAKLREDEKRGLAGGVDVAVNEDIHRVLAGKTHFQLSVLQAQIMKKLSSNEPVDVEYWETLLRELVVFKAKAKLTDMHQELLASRLDQLRTRQREEALKVQEELERILSMQEEAVEGRGVLPGEGIPVEPVDQELTEKQDEAFNVPEKEEITTEQYDRSMSPEPMPRLDAVSRDLPLLDPYEDLKQLMEQRRKVLSSKIIPMKSKSRPEPEAAEEQMEQQDASIASAALFEQEAARGVDEDEAIFNIEAELAKQSYMWQDKYRPRKPRYFNRVHTGYEWNKYNQTHYDEDNPPPKVVQGYKFNIFYPDLIDKSVAPTYYIEKDPESPETVLIRFHAGPPYEDIAFRIVNREWEYSHKNGFKCSFDRGVLSLWFHFKRQFYRK